MFSRLKILYNNGDNNGEVIIKTLDKEIRCHKFIIENICENINLQYNYIDLYYEYKLVNIVMNYIYSEKISDIDLSNYDIINLFRLLYDMKCYNSVIGLKNYYLKKFPKTLNDDNWIDSLKLVFGHTNYSELEQEILNYYQNSILTNNDSVDKLMLNSTPLNNEIENILFKLSLSKIYSLNEEINRDLTSDEDKDLASDLNNYIKKFKSEEDKLDSDEENLKTKTLKSKKEKKSK